MTNDDQYIRCYKYQLSQMDQHASLAQFDKLAKWVRRKSTVVSICQLRSTDNNCEFIAPSIHICRTKMTIQCNEQWVVVKFSKSRVSDVTEVSTFILVVTRISLKDSETKEAPKPNSSIHPASSIELQLVTDRQTDRQTPCHS